KPFQFDVPERTFTKPRTFLITEVDLGPAPVAPVVPASSAFPPVDPDGKGNVIPLILTDPFAVNSSGPNTTGDIVRIDQAELDVGLGRRRGAREGEEGTGRERDLRARVTRPPRLDPDDAQQRFQHLLRHPVGRVRPFAGQRAGTLRYRR